MSNERRTFMSTSQPSGYNQKPLEAEEVIVHVPKGQAGHVKVVESDVAQPSAEIVVQVSKKRKAGIMPVLGVIVK
jgi:hypothetical protein